MLTRDQLRNLTLLFTLTLVLGCTPSAEPTSRAGGEVIKAVSYTHLTLPTIYSV